MYIAVNWCVRSHNARARQLDEHPSQARWKFSFWCLNIQLFRGHNKLLTIRDVGVWKLIRMYAHEIEIGNSKYQERERER